MTESRPDRDQGSGATRDAGIARDWQAIAAEMRRQTGVPVRLDEPLALHTTMRVGGPSDLLAVAESVGQLVALVQFARTGALPYVVLGRGSDLVVSDRGFCGLTILCRAEGHRFEGERLIAESGLPMARAATLAQKAGLSGLEFGLAIPGTVGGAVWGNAGAHGGDVASVLESVTILTVDGVQIAEPAERLGFAYRESRFKAPSAAAADLILTATFRLAPADPAVLKTRLDEIRTWRREHQPIESPSAGSVFRNPPGDSAGRLIEACGLKRTRVGGAVISDKHANFIVNEGSATAADVRRLAEQARAEVRTRFGVDLVYEVQFLGDWTESEVEER